MTFNMQTIRELAYRLWEERGRPEGHSEEDWLEAERQLSSSQPLIRSASKSVDEASKGSFPASDPPASHLPDEPPANAAAKWAAAAKHKRGAKAAPPIKVPNPPEDEVARVPPESPKVGSRDALGG
jgi:hypothetical protein